MMNAARQIDVRHDEAAKDKAHGAANRNAEGIDAESPRSCRGVK